MALDPRSDATVARVGYCVAGFFMTPQAGDADLTVQFVEHLGHAANPQREVRSALTQRVVKRR